jgi:1-phosphatidylinositol-4-phosphate 5-kinase
MNSVYHTDRHLHSFYDLKGSVLGRAAKPIHDVKKDNDLRQGMPDSAVALPPNVRERMRKQIVADCEFMEKMDIMDYSMLIGIHHMPLAQERSHASDSYRVSSKRQAGSFTLGDLMKKKRNNSLSSIDQDAKMFEGDIISPQSLRHLSKVALSSDVQNKASQSVSSAGTPTLAASEKSKDSARQWKRHEEKLSSLQVYEQGYEDDDDGSYLEGSEEYKKNEARLSANGASAKLGGSAFKIEDIEYKKAQTVEQIYWPFHRYYDIYGDRRMLPTPCTACSRVECTCGRDQELLAGLKIPPFEPPLSTRKDGGLMMDTTGFDLPMKVIVHGQEQLCEGKIFYMGIIDILQQYNIRKRFEARYRRLQSNGWQDASCVNPHIYADRFVQFFDEYSQRGDTAANRGMGEGEKQIADVRSWDKVKIIGSHSSDDIEVSHQKEE